jgi:hypothetical protein
VPVDSKRLYFSLPQIQVGRPEEVAEMIWVGSFKSLQSALRTTRFTAAPLEVHTWLRSDIGLISPFVDWLISLIAESRCVLGKEEFVELALREAVSNAMTHGNRTDARSAVLPSPLVWVVRDRISARFTYNGTFTKPFMGYRPNGAPVQSRSIDIWRVKDAKFAEPWDELNLLEVFQQIGARR